MTRLSIIKLVMSIAIIVAWIVYYLVPEWRKAVRGRKRVEEIDNKRVHDAMVAERKLRTEQSKDE